MQSTGWILLGAIGLVLAWLIATYNGLVARRQRSRQAFADIDVQLRARHDLIPNLVETVQGFATHERATLEAVLQARAAALAQPGGSEGQSRAELALGQALGRVVALAEAYPELKADAGFRQLQQELSDIENKLAAARRFFNHAVADYNAAIESFPAMLVARRFGFEAQAFFALEEADRARISEPPRVDFPDR